MYSLNVRIAAQYARKNRPPFSRNRRLNGMLAMKFMAMRMPVRR